MFVGLNQMQIKRNILFVAIEAGALIKSFDGGKTWEDGVKNGPYDTHTLASHKKAPQILYSADGDAYFESQDYDMIWKNSNKGLEDNTYLMSMAVNSNDHQNKVVSAANKAWKAHMMEKMQNRFCMDYLQMLMKNGNW